MSDFLKKLLTFGLDKVLKGVPLAGWRTKITAYLSTTVPALFTLLESPPETEVEWVLQILWILAGPVISSFYELKGDK